ncbi:MAG: hypothetical protein ACK5MV_10565 [Aminipila sp.]
MATNTTNYGLVKPTENQTADIAVINANMDKVDEALFPLNSLDSEDTKKALAAAQGKVLSDRLTEVNKGLSEEIANRQNAVVQEQNTRANTDSNLQSQITANKKAVNVDISEALRVLYGLSVDNANVEETLKRAKTLLDIESKRITMLESDNLTSVLSNSNIVVPNGITGVKIYACAAGAGNRAGEAMLGEDFRVSSGQTISCTVGAGNTIISGAGINRTLVAGSLTTSANIDIFNIGVKMGFYGGTGGTGGYSTTGKNYGGQGGAGGYFGSGGGGGGGAGSSTGSSQTSDTTGTSNANGINGSNSGSCAGAGGGGTANLGSVGGNGGKGSYYYDSTNPAQSGTLAIKGFAPSISARDLFKVLPNLSIGSGGGGGGGNRAGNFTGEAGGAGAVSGGAKVNAIVSGGSGGGAGGYGAGGGLGGAGGYNDSSQSPSGNSGSPSPGMILFVWGV